MNTKRLLFVLIPIFIASLIYGYLQMPQQERVSAVTDLSAPTKQKVQKESAGGNRHAGSSRLRRDLLERKSQPYPGVRRDLFFADFAAGQYEEEVADDSPVTPPVVILPPVVIPVAPPPPPPSVQEVANMELSPYKFVGFFKKGEKQTIFLSSGGEIFLVRKGDFLGRDRKYYVLDITDTSLELRKEGAGDFSIKLTDQGSLSAVSLPGKITPERAPVFSPGAVPGMLPGQVITLPDQPELLPLPDEEPQIENQLQPEEDNNETQN